MLKTRDGYAKLVGTSYNGNANYLLKSDGGVWEVHTSRNNEANKIVRTDASGYILAGWINTTSGDMTTTTATRVYCSNDEYIRYKTFDLFTSDIAGKLYWANVPIQTSSNTAKVPTFANAYAIHNNTDNSVFSAENTNGKIQLLTATNRGLYDGTKAVWIIGTNGTNTWASQGNFGIGTTSPSYKLHVNGVVYSTGLPGFYNKVDAENWSYLRLHSGDKLWDIAQNSSRSNALEFRAGGGDPTMWIDYAAQNTASGLIHMRNGLEVIDDSSNNANDSLVYFRSRSSNDWGLIVDKTEYDYGIDIRVKTDASYAVRTLGDNSSEKLRITGKGQIRFNGQDLYFGLNLSDKIYYGGLSDLALIRSSTNTLRFGGTSWDWDQWAGLKYTGSSDKKIYLGLPDRNIFNSNSAITGGYIGFPGIKQYNLGREALVDADFNAHYGTTSSPEGWYKIRINPETSWMISFTIRVYQSYKSADILIQGYNYGSNHWYSPSALIIGGTYNSISVKFGYDKDYGLWVAIPAESYTGISILGANNGYTLTDWYNGFTITNVTESALTTVQSTVTAYRPWYRNETVSNASSAITADILDGYHASGLLTAFDNYHNKDTNAHLLYITVGGTTKYVTPLWLETYSDVDYGANGLQYFNTTLTTRGTATTNGTPTDDWYHIIRMNHGNNSGYYVDIATCFHSWDLWYRRVANGSDKGWKRLLDTANSYVTASSTASTITINNVTVGNSTYKIEWANRANRSSYADAVRDPDYHDTSHRRTTMDNNFADGALHYYLATSSTTTSKPNVAKDSHVLHASWDNGSYEGLLAIPTDHSLSCLWRSLNGGTWGAWKTLADSTNGLTYFTAFSEGGISSSGNTLSQANHSITIGGLTRTAGSSSCNIINSLSVSKLTSTSSVNLTAAITVNGVASADKTLSFLWSSALTNTSVSDPANAKNDTNKQALQWFNSISGYPETDTRYAGTNAGFPVSNNANGILYLGCHALTTANAYYAGQLGVSSNGRLYYRYNNGGAFSTAANGGSWNTIAWTSELKNPANYYWANIKVSSSSSNTTIPTFGTVNIFKDVEGNAGDILHDLQLQVGQTTKGGYCGSPVIAIGVSKVNKTETTLEHIGMILAKLCGVGYNTLSLNPISGSVVIGKMFTSTNNYRLEVDGYSYASEGFIKGGSSNSYVLLGGGSHKLESSLSVSLADKVDGYHIASPDGFIYTSVKEVNSASSDFYITIDTNNDYFHDFIGFKIEPSYDNVCGTTYIKHYCRNKKLLVYATDYNGNKVIGASASTDGNTRYIYLKLTKHTTAGKIKVYSTCSLNAVTVSTTAPSGITFEKVKPGYTSGLYHVHKLETIGSSWIYGRDYCIAYQTTTLSSWHPVIGFKTPLGSWELGSVGDENFYFSYGTDANYNSNTDSVMNGIHWDSSGNSYAAHFYENSDIRYKNIIKNININTEILAKVPLFDFEWKETKTIGTGTSALEILKILPNIVSGEEKLSVDYGVLGTVSGIIACKELVNLKSEIEILKNKIKELEEKLNGRFNCN